MEIGMLWFDNNAQRNLAEKIARAVAYYRTKYGQPPTECFVNPAMLGPDPLEVAGGVHLHPAANVLKNHLWLGVGEPVLAGNRNLPKKEAGRHNHR